MDKDTDEYRKAQLKRITFGKYGVSVQFVCEKGNTNFIRLTLSEWLALQSYFTHVHGSYDDKPT